MSLTAVLKKGPPVRDFPVYGPMLHVGSKPYIEALKALGLTYVPPKGDPS